MAYRTFSLKYRPQTFEDIVAQDHVATTLRNAVAEGRVAHAYLFAGPRGTGKTSTARVLAKALNCEKGPTPDPCGECSTCVAIAQGRAMDILEIDAASNRGIDDIRDLREKVKYTPAEARCKVYILDEAHMLTPEANNALLKTLEEPPPHCYFILATTEAHRILPTIKSRCQAFEFRPIPLAQLVEALRRIADAEGLEVDEVALGIIARAASGALRDAQSILDQVIAYSTGQVTAEVVNSVLGVTDAEVLARIADAVADADLAGCFAAVDEVVSSGKDIAQLLDDLALYFRDLLRLSLNATPPAWMQVAEAQQGRMSAQAARLGADRIGAVIQRLGDAARELKTSSQHALLLELTLAELSVQGAQAVRATAPAEAADEAPPPEPEVEVAADAEPEAAVESAPEAEPVVAAPPPAEGISADQPLDLDLVRRHWPRVAEALRELGRVSAVAFVAEAQPVACDGGGLTVSFPAHCEFHYRQAQGRYRSLLETALERVYQRPLSLQCVLAGEAETAPRDQAATQGEQGPGAEGSPQAADAEAQQRAVDRVLDLFEGSREVQ